MKRLALLLLLVVPGHADEETALFFVKKARDAVVHEDYVKAEHWCKRALSEEKDYAPALLALAEIAEARHDREGTVKHLEACIAQDGKGLSDKERDAVAKARSRLKKIDAARFEFQRLANQYVKKLLALARREAKRKPKLARECWRNVLLVDPKNEEAAGHLGPADVKPQEGTPLFNGKDLEQWAGSAPAWTVKDGHLFGRVPDAANVNRHKQPVKGNYSVICEMRVLEDIGDDPLFGIMFGLRGSYDHFGFWIWPDDWRLEHQTGERERAELARKTFRTHKAKYDRFAWNTYRIDVDGKKITGFVNGNKLWSTSGAIRSLDGHVGCWVQEQSVEIRSFRLIGG